MIFIDSSEYRDGSTMPRVDGAVIVDGLEDFGGCDAMISTLNIPASKPGLIREHIEHGACLLNFKRGSDLAASIPDRRLNLSLAKMHQLTSNSFQRWLFTTGILTDRESDDTAWFDGVKLSTLAPGLGHIGYRACCTALRHWQMRGGRHIHVARLSDLPVALRDFEQDLCKAYTNPVLDIFPDAPRLTEDSDDPLQMLRRISDWRVPMSYLIGPVKTQKLYDAVKGNGAFAFAHLSNPEDWPHLPKGVYESDAKKFRERMHLAPNEVINVGLIKGNGEEY